MEFLNQNKKRSSDFLQNLGFFLLLLLISVGIYGDFLFTGPKFWHTWAQADRFCITLGFVENGLNFFKPQVYNLGTQDGTTGVEFPILYYLSAIFMKIAGNESPFFVRFFSLLASLVGLTSLFRIFRLYRVPVLLAALGVSLVFFSPVFLYYQANFNPNHFSFGLTLTAILYFILYIREQKNYQFHTFNVLATIASLAKTTFTIYYFACFIFLFYHFWKNKSELSRKTTIFIISVLIFILHYFWNSYLNLKYQANVFTNNLEFYEDISQAIWMTGPTLQSWYKELLLPFSYVFICLIVFLLGVYGELKISKRTFIFANLIICACISVYYLMGKQYIAHDYYFIDIVYIPVGLFLVKLFSKILNGNHNQKLINIISLVLMVFAGITGVEGFNKRLVLKLDDRCDLITHDFEGSWEILDKLNISRQEKIIVFDAFATNEILFYLKRKGYTKNSMNPEEIKSWKSFGLKYIVVEQVSYEKFLDRIRESEPFLNLIVNNGKFRLYEIK
jgi:hypothetical protein